MPQGSLGRSPTIDRHLLFGTGKMPVPQELLERYNKVLGFAESVWGRNILVKNQVSGPLCLFPNAKSTKDSIQY